ncbi:MAG TPA: HEAT repeat domain-containing protein [Polyangiales bacterium]
MSWLLPPLPPNWDAALRDVRASGMQARLAAAKRLSQPPDGQADNATRALLTLARDVDARVRAAAFESLGELQPQSCVQNLVEGTRDTDPLVRELAVIALSQLPPALGADALLDATASQHPEVRFQAVVTAAEHCGQRAHPVVRRLLQDADNRVRASAVRAAGVLLAREPSAPLSRALRDALQDGDRHVRTEAAVLLTAAGDGAALDALLEALADPELVWSALDAAPRLADTRVVQAVAAIAQSFLRPRAVKAAAARALVRMGDPRGEHALRAVLTGLRGDGRSYAVEVVAETGLAELAPALVALVKRPRGVDPLLLARSLAALAPKSLEARAGLQAMAVRDDPAGALSRAELARLPAPAIPGPRQPSP